ncbi:hypothetical protein MAPG_07233, partial [Magnaporthiopsis poae ATCC 64411]|uniref:Uncharacterized protein n=1 Tax=Magnaporthiopsis poae (strain ATCC 64411 / 73-15) TaxID=644358 RepID=A0A0C4E445_MAGP6
MPKSKPRVYPLSSTTETTEATSPRQETQHNPEHDDDDRLGPFIDRIKRFALTELEDGEDEPGASREDAGSIRVRISRMPRFGDLSFYDVGREERNRLWELEARRLTKAARGPVSGLVFPAQHCPSLPQAARVADMIHLGLQICILDDQMVLHDYHKQCYERNRSSQSYTTLQNRSRGSYGLPGWTGRPYEADRLRSDAVPGWEGTRQDRGQDRGDGMEAAPDFQVRVVDKRGCGKETPAEPIISDTVDIQPEMVKPEQSALMHSEEDPGTATNREAKDTTGQGPSKPQSKEKKVAIDMASLPAPETPAPLAADDDIGQVSNLRQYYSFVDHLTAALARVATHCIHSSYWRVAVLAVLAKLSTKLKIVAIDLPGSIESCLHRNGWPLRLGEYDYNHGPNEAAAAAAVEWQFPLIDDNDTVASRYSVENSVVSRWLQDCLAQMLVELSGARGGGGQQLYSQEAEVDVSVLVFHAGANAVPTLVQQDRQGNVGGMSERLGLVLTREAVELVIDVGGQLGKEVQQQQQQLAETVEYPPGEVRLDVCRERRGEGESDGHEIIVERCVRAITDAAGVVTVLVMLALAQPALGREFRMLLQEMSALNAFGELSPPALDYTALISLRSGQPPRTESEDSGDPLRMPKSPSRAEEQSKPDAVPLPRSLLARNRLHPLLRPSTNDSRSSFPASEEAVEEAVKEAVKQTIRDARRSLDKIRNTSSKWLIEETAVIVKCPVYVWTTVFLCFVLVAGGMMIGFLVGDRIAGVDPFGITNFTWVIAGFTLVIAKSVRVSDWPWRDFLLGRVRCRSVMELQSVTSMDAQDIIMFLLSTQTQNKLATCGPFSKPFKSAAGTGFSIDVQPELRTLMACGLVPVKVATLQGPHLVFLDLMPEAGNRLTVIEHSRRSSRTGESFLGFALPPDPRSASDAKLQRYSDLAWVKVLGLYRPR